MITRGMASITGGFVPAIIVAVIAKNPSAFAPAVAEGAELANASKAIEHIQEDLKALAKTKRIENAEVDKLHKIKSLVWQLPEKIFKKIPKERGQAAPNKKGVGYRWRDPNNPGNGIRIDKGNPEHTLPSQKVDHVIVRYNGKIIGRNGEPISDSIKMDPTNAHIPLDEWSNWNTWYSPE